MSKRTNLKERIVEIIIKSIIPVFIVVVVMLNGFDNTLNDMFSALSFIVSENSYSRKDITEDENEILLNKAPVENNISENKQSITAAASVSYEVPGDVKLLVDKAEKKYANSSKSGKISSFDYSMQNATNEFDGIYLRNTTLNHIINIEEYLNKPVYANIDKSKPAVLIYHTHTSEAYELLETDFYTDDRSTRSENQTETVVRVGEEICKMLEDDGYKVIHDKTVYDESLNGSYERSREAVSKILRENPSIQIVLDIHRDSIYQKDGARIKTVTDINGKRMAQIMLVSGCEDGNVTDFPNWEKNLTFAIKLQKKLTKDNSALMRPLMFSSRKYNMDLVPCALQVEIGTDANTLTEAIFSARLFGKTLAEFLKEYET